MLAVPSRDLPIWPNLLSAARAPLALALPLTTTTRGALTLIGAAGLTDVLDGWLARRLGQTTETGAIVDGIADKAFAAGVLAMLLARRRVTPAGALLLAAREIIELPLALFVLARPARAPIPAAANRAGKAATALELAAVTAAVVGSRAAKPLIAIAGVAGAIAGVSYWARELRGRRRSRLPDAQNSV